MPLKTDYLAAAICAALQDCGSCDIAEIEAQMEDYYAGTVTTTDIEREIAALVAAESVDVVIDPDYGTLYMDADE